VLAGATAQPVGASAVTCTPSGAPAGPVADTPSFSATFVGPSAFGMTTGWAGDRVAASDLLGAGRGIAAIKALSALACVRQSRTFGESALSAPDQRPPS